MNAGGYVGAYNIYDDGYTVGSTARCSCGIGHYGYETTYFIDECPNCGGNLYFEQGAYSGPAYTSPELFEDTMINREHRTILSIGEKVYGHVHGVIWISVANAGKAMTAEDTG